MEGLLYLFLAKLADPVLVLVAGISAYLVSKKTDGLDSSGTRFGITCRNRRSIHIHGRYGPL